MTFAFNTPFLSVKKYFLCKLIEKTLNKQFEAYVMRAQFDE
jgi:hypothetical protein